ncbi:MAG: hypothetical protein WD333_12100 [Dehalococcoidia bacterium]
MNSTLDKRLHRRELWVIAIVIILGMSLFALSEIARALHDPHQDPVVQDWHGDNLRGIREHVGHPSVNVFHSSATSQSLDQADNVMKAEIFWADRHCFAGSCWWNTHDNLANDDYDRSVNTGALQFEADECRDYKFYSKHWNFDYGGTTVHDIDENEGVTPFLAGCA